MAKKQKFKKSIIIGVVVLTIVLISACAGKKSLSESPEGYNADIFDYCGYDSDVLGKKINEVIDSYGLFLVGTDTVGPEEARFSSFPIYMREGQKCAQACYLDLPHSPTYYFILDNDDVVVGLVFIDTEGFQDISKYKGNFKTAPRKVKISSGMANAENILCWKLNNGYRFIFSKDFSLGTMALGYADVIDPTQMYDYVNLIYGPIREQYSDSQYMTDDFYNCLAGVYTNPDNNILIEIDYQDCICRSVINGKWGEKDLFYLDRFDSYELIDDNTYLIKVKCGDSKFSYLLQDIYYEDGTGKSTLYLNDVDGWTYSDDYINNSKYCFYCDFTWEDDLSSNDEIVIDDNSDEQYENDFEKDYVKESENDLGILIGHYEDSNGDKVDIYSDEEMVRYIQGGNQSHTFNEKICDYEKYENGILLKVNRDDLKYSYFYDTDENTLYVLYTDEWEADINNLYYEADQVYVKVDTVPAPKQNANDKESYDLNDDMIFKEYNNREVTEVVGREYIAPPACEFIKEGEDYYLYPPNYDNILVPMDGMHDFIPFDEPLRISKDAEVGLTKDIQIYFNGEWNEYLFIYEYNDFYKIADKLFSDNRWSKNEYEWLYFDYKGNTISFAPIVILDEKGDIIMFKEYNYEIEKYIKGDAQNG